MNTLLCGLASCVCALLLAGCNPTEPESPARHADSSAQPPAAMPELAAVELPREAQAGGAAILLQPGVRSYQVRAAVHADKHATGITPQSAGSGLHFAPADGPAPSRLFLSIQRAADPRSSMDWASLQLEWPDGPPAAGQGFYIGAADFAANNWVWHGPLRSAGDSAGFSGTQWSPDPASPASGRIALVNLSDKPAVLEFFNFTTVSPADADGDEQLYFVRKAATQCMINRAELATPGVLENVILPQRGVDYANVRVRADGDKPLLIFDRREEGGYWQVWQADLDGGNQQLRYGGDQDVQFAGFAPGLEFEFTVNGPLDGNCRVEQHLPGAGKPAYTSVTPVGFREPPRWFEGHGLEIGLVGAGQHGTTGRRTVMLFLSGGADGPEYYGPLFGNQQLGDDSTDPFCFRWADGELGLTELTLYSSKLKDEDSWSIRVHERGRPANENEGVFVSGEDLRIQHPSVSPDCRWLSFVACPMENCDKQLYVQPIYLRVADPEAVVTQHVISAVAWYDPTPAVTAVD